MSIGQEWKRGREAKKTVVTQAGKDRLREEAERAIAKIPELVREAIEEQADCVLVLPRSLEQRDIAHHLSAHGLAKDLAHRLLVEDDLAGAALLVFQWCGKNDLVCEIRRGFGGEFTLVAVPA